MIQWLRKKMAPRSVVPGNQGMLRHVSTASNNADELIYEPLQGPSPLPVILGYIVGQPYLVEGADPTPIVGGPFVPTTVGYPVAQGYRNQPLIVTDDSLTQQELI